MQLLNDLGLMYEKAKRKEKTYILASICEVMKPFLKIKALSARVSHKDLNQNFYLTLAYYMPNFSSQRGEFKKYVGYLVRNAVHQTCLETHTQNVEYIESIDQSEERVNFKLDNLKEYEIEVLDSVINEKKPFTEVSNDLSKKYRRKINKQNISSIYTLAIDKIKSDLIAR
jgi:hypothetical protein